MPRFKVTGGFNEKDYNRVLDKVGNRGAKKLTKDIDTVTHNTAKQAAADSSSKAPVLTGRLRDSIYGSEVRVAPMAYEYGSNMPYATKQEYENPRHPAFIRKSMWNIETPYKQAISSVIQMHGGR